MSKKVLWIALTAFLVGCVANDLADNLDGGFVSEANAGIAEIRLDFIVYKWFYILEQRH